MSVERYLAHVRLTEINEAVRAAGYTQRQFHEAVVLARDHGLPMPAWTGHAAPPRWETADEALESWARPKPADLLPPVVFRGRGTADDPPR